MTKRWWQPRVSIRWVLLGTNGLTLFAPLLLVLGFRAYDFVLMRETEEKLAAEAVVLGEVWRSALADEGRVIEQIRPQGRTDSFFPWEPQIVFSTRVSEAIHGENPARGGSDSVEARAGRRIEPILQRARIFNLSGARVLDAEGCVVASSDGSDRGACLDALPEVAQALAGQYGWATRRRLHHGPEPPLDSISRRGRVQVFVALPLFEGGRVIGVVRMARTSLSTLEHLWKNKRWFLALLAGSAFFLVAVSLASYRMVAGPLRALTRQAARRSEGALSAPLTLEGWVPAEVGALHASLQQMTAQLQERALYVAGFAANASHELRTPLTAIRGAAELLRDSWPAMSDEQRERFLANIEADATRMQRLVRRLLTLARIENPVAPTTNVPPTNVVAFFEELAGSYEQQPAVTFEIGDVPVTLDLDEDSFSSAVRNLIDNALRHGAHVRVQTGRHAGRLWVEVTDDGPGIAPEHLPHVFDRFFTTERDRGGTGLGLAIVKAVAEGRGGSVTVVSRPGATTFRVEL